MFSPLTIDMPQLQPARERFVKSTVQTVPSIVAPNGGTDGAGRRSPGETIFESRSVPC